MLDVPPVLFDVPAAPPCAGDPPAPSAPPEPPSLAVPPLPEPALPPGELPPEPAPAAPLELPPLPDIAVCPPGPLQSAPPLQGSSPLERSRSPTPQAAPNAHGTSTRAQACRKRISPLSYRLAASGSR